MTGAGREPTRVMFIWERKRQVGDPMVSAPDTRMEEATRVKGESLNTRRDPRGMVSAPRVRVPLGKAQADSSTLALRGRVTSPPWGTTPLGHREAVPHGTREESPTCGQFTRLGTPKGKSKMVGCSGKLKV